ncbi:Cell death abnormality protein 8 [Toxocara canis]|uniref:XK-related protein n=1 Tax=Toxocara canis TaxID=6265 RepID=A0A0B2UUP4_TOXCA|nr:Cell death abnormality protein 8 [Toxocara canis]
MVLFERVPPKLVYFYDGCLSKNCSYNATNDGPLTGDSAEVTEIDESDRLPRLLVVRRFDILCFVFSAVSYALDVVCDALTAYIHFQANRFWTFLFISLLTVLPSIALNIISFVWWLDDAVARRRDMRQQVITCSRALMLRCLACIFQLGPIVWYVDAVIAAVRFRSCNSDRERRYFYCRMVEADRDASLLRFFEAFLESGPQLLVQGVVLAHSFWLLHPSEGIPLWMYFQTISVVMSLLSICWSVSIQHRSLRIARPDKLNLTPFETFLQLSWRCLTISSRYVLLVLFVLAFQFWTVVLIVTHYILSLLHIAALQHVDSEPGYVPLEFGLLLICAAVHLFTPFNMAEGPTRWRYTVAYVMETAENTVVAYLLLNCDDFAYPYKRSIISVALSVFVCGIGVMLLYYWRWHPTKRVSENDSSGRIFIEQGFSETEDIQTTALSENLKYIDSD